MLKELRGAVLAVLVLTLVLGLAYPLAVTGIAQVAFPNRADGSLIEVDGKVVGSKLAAQKFEGKQYFHPRPSAVDYNAAGTSFSNLGPTNPELAKAVRINAQAILTLEEPYNPGMSFDEIPVDAVTTSASGIDPHISPADARLQSARIAAERNLSPERVAELIDEHTDGRSFGLFGEPGSERARAEPRARSGDSMTRPDQSVFTKEIIGTAVADSFLKLDPRGLIRNPVIFVVELGAVITTAIFLVDAFRGATEDLWFVGVISLWLWLTVLFANFSEAIAEGRGKAQANALRATRTTTMARLLDGREVPASELQRGDVVVVEAGRGHPRRRRGDRRRRVGGRVGDHR